MNTKVEDYFKTYGGEFKKQIEIAKEFGVSKASVSLWSKELIEAEYLVEEEDYVENERGIKLYTPDGISKLSERAKNANLVNDLYRNKLSYLNIHAPSPPKGEQIDVEVNK
jgi:Mn-dependent DtxR family transcriptional regulator